MEHWQKEIITINFPELIRMTYVNQPMLSIFAAKNIFSVVDIEEISATVKIHLYFFAEIISHSNKNIYFLGYNEGQNFCSLQILRNIAN